MPLAVEVNDALATALSVLGTPAFVYAVWRGWVALRQTQTAADERAGEREEKAESQTFRHQSAIIKTQAGWIEDRDRKIEELRGDVDALAEKVRDCERDRARLQEQGRWMYKMLRRHGIISDSDEADYPGDVPTPDTDEITIARPASKTPKPEGG